MIWMCVCVVWGGVQKDSLPRAPWSCEVALGHLPEVSMKLNRTTHSLQLMLFSCIPKQMSFPGDQRSVSRWAECSHLWIRPLVLSHQGGAEADKEGGLERSCSPQSHSKLSYRFFFPVREASTATAPSPPKHRS